MAQEIKFGTDGWRGIIADDFTFDNVRRVAGAIASYVLKYEEAQRGVFVGYDTRFASPRAAQIVAEVIAAAGIPVKLANDYTPTPAVSYAVKHEGAAGGVMVTSSHNPWNWNGVKFKGKFGGSATPAIMKKIEEELAADAAPKGSKAAIEEVDLKKSYVAAVCSFADMDLDREDEIQVCGGCDVWFWTRRAGRNICRARRAVRGDSAGTEPAVSRDQSGAD